MRISHLGLGSYGREEEKEFMLFTSEQVNEASGDANYLTESYLYSDQNVSEQDDVEIVIPENFSFLFWKKGNYTLKYSELEFAGMANPNIDNEEY